MRNKTSRPISNRIAYFRETAGLTQQKIADIMGMDLENYQKREENADIDCMFILNVATILGIEVDRFLTDNEPKINDKTYFPIAPCGFFTRNEECFISALRMLSNERKHEIINLTRKAALYSDKSIQEIIEKDLPLN